MLKGIWIAAAVVLVVVVAAVLLRRQVLKWMSMAATAVLVVVVVGLFLRRQLFATGPVTFAVQALAVLLMVWARLSFGGRSFHAAANPTAGGIVTKGPYRFLRHPIYASTLWFLWAGFAAHVSVGTAIAVLVASGAVVVRILTEERLLVERYPEYREYAARTKRVIPFVL
jgi:protein-S-isoprenylcysteine O-methyltransferase Ste14